MRAFLDSSTIIFGLEGPDTNSNQVLRAVIGEKFEAVINEVVVAEVSAYVRARRGRAPAYFLKRELERLCEVKLVAEVAEDAERLRASVHPGDLVHAATVRHFRIPFLVALDSDYEVLPEYRTPRQFVIQLGLRPAATEY